MAATAITKRWVTMFRDLGRVDSPTSGGRGSWNDEPARAVTVSSRTLETKKVITVSVHTRKEVGTGLAHRIMKEAGL